MNCRASDPDSRKIRGDFFPEGHKGKQGRCQPRRLGFDRLCQSLYFHRLHVSLTPELEKAVKAKVASGLYNNASEVVREALRESLRREQENEWLKREAALGFPQLEAGTVTRVKTKQQFKALVRGGV